MQPNLMTAVDKPTTTLPPFSGTPDGVDNIPCQADRH